MSISFFTEPDKLNIQSSEMAYGEITPEGLNDRYLVENRFTFSSNAKAFAITKAFILISEDSEDANLLTIALYPLENTIKWGIPVKYFIYRGIRRNSVLTDDFIKEPGEIEHPNLLQVVKNQMDSINEIDMTDLSPEKNILGFESLSEDEYLKAYFIDSSKFTPLVVTKGCELGMFDSASECAVEVVLDGFQHELTVADFRDKNASILSFPQFELDEDLSNKEQLIDQFNDRQNREKILGFVDIVAYYGCIENQNGSIAFFEEEDLTETYLNKFINRNKIYIDLRDNWGFSYNHYFKTNDEINYSISETDEDGNLVYTELNYYDKWPIGVLNNITEPDDDLGIQIQIPIIAGRPSATNILSVYTKNGSPKSGHKSKYHFLLNEKKVDGLVSLRKSEPITLELLSDDSGKLKSSYFLLKLNRDDKDYFTLSNNFLKSFIPLNVNMLYDYSDIEDGTFMIRKISSLFAPLQYDNQNGDFYTTSINIALDKHNVTYFSMKEEVVFSTRPNLIQKSNLSLQEMAYNWGLDDDLDHDPMTKNVGFLEQIFNHENSLFSNNNISPEKLEGPFIEDVDFNFLMVTTQNSTEGYEKLTNEFNSISFTHEEYDAMTALTEEVIIDNAYLTIHPMYVCEVDVESYRTFTQLLHQSKIRVCLPMVAGELNSEFITLMGHPINVELIDGSEIVISAAVHSS
ncbi:MAG: hypothetical protein GQ574_01160 [Crocinitomix sp.]|nr:hypothetical protein [Crocinitomix sp.]